MASEAPLSSVSLIIDRFRAFQFLFESEMRYGVDAKFFYRVARAPLLGCFAVEAGDVKL